MATRSHYAENGCHFVLQPFTAQGESYGDNITSIQFGISKRYTEDPPPVSYNFVKGSSSMSASATTALQSSLSTQVISKATSSLTDTPASKDKHGLSSTNKLEIGLGVSLSFLLIAVTLGAIILTRRKIRQKEHGKTLARPQISNGLATNSVYEVRDPHNMARSRMETMASLCQLPSHETRSTGTERPLSELMSIERVELD